ncbi:hypothetical protein EG028_06665 [Chitinophaga barathri]|uniref:Uncharacterized protein n=1 Tax=Chitinophaga barathri TaxID=1647451 RepID=A0A3N4MDM5_9BACT|nr:hypothetical protein EG028_06665 [Chitinophaga barathri]
MFAKTILLRMVKINGSANLCTASVTGVYAEKYLYRRDEWRGFTNKRTSIYKKMTTDRAGGHVFSGVTLWFAGLKEKRPGKGI